MRVLRFALVLAAVGITAADGLILAQQTPKGVRLADLTWQEAESVLRPETVVVIPLGAAAKEHGPHLKLSNDLLLAEYLAKRVADSANVVVAPPLTYHFYPAFLEYPGSTSLTIDTARMLTAEVVRTLARYGPRRFYVLNTAVSTERALDPAVAALASDGILLGYTELGKRLDQASARVRQQEGGSHADEVETSMMLYINPGAVEWELRGLTDAAGKVLPPFEGLVTLVVKGGGGGWQIEAWRYTQKPAAAPMPTLLRKPGFIGRQ